MTTKSKRGRNEEVPARPKKRRTLSEQIDVSRLQEHESMRSPRGPPPGRVHQALTDRIKSLKDEKEELEGENGVLKGNLVVMEKRLATIETVSEQLQSEMQLLRERVEKAEQGATAAATELVTFYKGFAKKQSKSIKK